MLSVQCVSRPSGCSYAFTCMLLFCAQARIKGSLKVFFYDTEAGVTQVEQVFARPRALAKSPYMLEVRLWGCQSLILMHVLAPSGSIS